MCNCQKWLEIIAAIVVFVLALWPQLLGATASKWVLVIVAIALVLHALFCKSCMCKSKEIPSKKKR